VIEHRQPGRPCQRFSCSPAPHRLLRQSGDSSIVTGMRARPKKPGGFTLIEILVAVAIMGVLTAMTFPALLGARAMAKQGSCANKLRQIAMAMAMYRDDFGELAPHLSSLHPTYVTSPSLFLCPQDPVEGRHDGGDYLEGDAYLPTGVSYTYVPNWKYAWELGWWRQPPRYGPGKWEDSTPLAMCHWHWAKGREWRRDLDVRSWGDEPKGWVLLLAAGGSVHKIRAETPADEFSPSYH
jgi:prepilin-type N-terminal cleavage/methylation domain-containing protein